MDEILKGLGLSRYERQARFAPGLFVILPVLALCVVWISKFWGSVVGAGALLAFAGAYILMGMVRDRGLAVQERLDGARGGRPSDLAIRHGGPLLNDETRRRHHDAMRAHLGVPVPTPEEQVAAADACHPQFASAVDRLVQLTRSDEILLSENITYGFRRNLRGMKPIALWTLLGCLTFDVSALAMSLSANDERIVAAITLIPVYLLLILVWVTQVNDRFVEAASWKYAERLFACCELLGQQNR